MSGQYPVTRDPDKVIVGSCDRQCGGVIKPRPPVYSMVVTNTADSLAAAQIWTDEDFDPVLEEDNGFIFIDNL